MTALVVRADSRTLPLADSTVDLVVTSPPYFGLRSYQDGGEHYAGQVGDEATPAEFVAALLAVTAECVRVLKPSGSIWVNLGDKYAGNVPGSSRGSSDGTTRRGPRRVQRTSGNDARAALSIACGADPNDVHPVNGTWDRPAEPVQLTLEDAA